MNVCYQCRAQLMAWLITQKSQYEDLLFEIAAKSGEDGGDD